jgi:hypothetical protein
LRSALRGAIWALPAHLGLLVLVLAEVNLLLTHIHEGVLAELGQVLDRHLIDRLSQVQNLRRQRMLME